MMAEHHHNSHPICFKPQEETRYEQDEMLVPQLLTAAPPCALELPRPLWSTDTHGSAAVAG